jgi:Leucine rich repeat
MPTRIENFFPFLQEIEVDSSGLKRLTRETFVGLHFLTMAIFPGNELEILPNHLFVNNPRLTHVDFSENRIKSIGRNLFDNLSSLKYLMFDDNECYQGEGLGIPSMEDIEMVKYEILKNCSTGARAPERRVVQVSEEVKFEEPRREEKRPESRKTDEKKKEEKFPQTTQRANHFEPKHVKGVGSLSQASSLLIIVICCHLHVFAAFCP